MIRKEAMKIILEGIGEEPIISANGFISRDLFELKEKKSNFYMIGSMGLASSIGLGVALKNPKKRIFVFDGDGNILMNLGSLTTIGSLQPKNLIHIIFDNGSHESTGGQPTISSKIEISNIAKNCNYEIFTTEILVASIRTAQHVIQSAIYGADIVTVPPKVMYTLADHELTKKGLEMFLKDWKDSGNSI